MTIEDRLRDAYQAKTGQLTEARLDQLTAARQYGLDELFGTEHTAELPIIDLATRPSRRQHRWIAPTLAAAAVAAVAVGVIMVANQPSSRPRPNPPASHVSSPPASSSAPAPTPSASASQTVVAPPYLPAGQTGSRDQVPWSIVGSGWRLLQQQRLTSTLPIFDNRVYLYDPAGGRYRITDSLPSGARLVAWSPDGNRAMFTTTGQGNTTGYYQLSLRSGSISRLLQTGPANLIGYSRPQGLAFVTEVVNAENGWRFARYSVDGSLELSYPSAVHGITLAWAGAFYTADGRELVVQNQQDGSAVLIGNDGHFIRTFADPAAYVGCQPVKLWTAGSMLERCTHVGATQSHFALIVQPLSGGAPQVLADAPARNTDGYWDAWQLSNGDVLLSNWGDCNASTYDILEAGTGAIRPLHWPSGIPKSSDVISMSGDVATFEHRSPNGCGEGVPQQTLYSYGLLTGQTAKLLDGSAIVLDWPGDPS